MGSSKNRSSMLVSPYFAMVRLFKVGVFRSSLILLSKIYAGESSIFLSFTISN
jgi:hypothetical protein